MFKFILVLSGLTAAAASALAIPMEFSAAVDNRSAWARFDTDGDKIIITLANTSTADVLAPEDVLTAVFFGSSLSLDLQPISAVVPSNSTVRFGSTDPGGHVGGEWAYASNLDGAPGGGTYGISSSGLGLFGPGDRFPGQNLQGAASVNGLEYGIVPAADDPLTGNAPVTGKNALISDRVVFTLAGIPSGFDPSIHIHDVFFQYGTDLSEGGIPNPPVIPEARTLALFALGSLFIATRRAVVMRNCNTAG